jgi:hypothetical protein
MRKSPKAVHLTATELAAVLTERLAYAGALPDGPERHALLKEIEQTAADVTSPDDKRLLDGTGVLVAGKSSRKTESLKLEQVTLESLGQVVVDGRTFSLADVARRKPLDTSSGKRSDVADARRSIELARESVAALKEKIQTFQTDELRPRLGDVATAINDLFDVLARVEEACSAQGPYFSGTKLGLVDTAYAPLFQRLDLSPRIRGDRRWEKLPRVSRWAQSLAKLPEVRSSVKPDFEKKFLAYVREGGTLIA